MTPETLSRPIAARIAALSSSADMPENTPDVAEGVLDAAKAALARGETHYTDRAGLMPLRTLVSEKLAARSGVKVEPKAITITCGLIEARSVAIRVLAKPGSAIVCPQMLPDVIGIAALIGAPVAQTAELVPDFSLAYLTPADPPEQIAAVLKTQAYVIWDLSIPGTAPHPATNPDIAGRVTTIDSLDNELPGWRVGWVAGSEMADRLRSFKQALTICTTNVSQWAAVEWLKTH
jgi:aspartate/methionine/tyrosine aminotransferase